MSVVPGHVAPGFEGVRDAFIGNFTDGLEMGSAFSAWRNGEPLVDLWGGDAAPGQPWRQDSLQLI